MSLTLQCLVINAADPRALASFWEAALGWRRTHDTPSEVVLEPPQHSMEEGVVPDLLFVRVPEEKAGKNRLHLDLRPDDQEAEVTRLEALGARRTTIGQTDEASWVVLADPEGYVPILLRRNRAA